MKGESGRRWVVLPLLAYIVMVSVLALTHDMWRDEVRAFSVATRAPSWSRMLFDLHEEGHPVLWYAILRAGFAVTNSALVLPVAALLIGIGTAYLILRFAPFALWARLLAIFGVFLGYELSVVARNYGIGVLLMLAACALFPKRGERPWLLAIVLALMANTSVHAAAASALLLLVWCLDLVDAERRAVIARPVSVASLLLVVAGIVAALATARPPAEMAFAFSGFSPSALSAAVVVDPGLGLMGANGASLVASGSIPWWRIGLDVETVSRILVNVALLSIAWSLRKHGTILAAVVLAILGFEVIFGLLYPAGLRHEAVLVFLIVGLCWIAIDGTRDQDRENARRRITFGLLPLLVLQAAAMPFVAWRGIQKPESMAPALASVIRATPRYSEAVLLSEPDPLMETMPYYVSNPVFMARQGELDYRAFFDNGTKRKLVLSLARLTAVADSVACATRRPVLLSIGHRRFLLDSAGSAQGPYESVFTWTGAEKGAFDARVRPLQWFAGATSDENFRTYELAPGPECSGG